MTAADAGLPGEQRNDEQAVEQAAETIVGWSCGCFTKSRAERMIRQRFRLFAELRWVRVELQAARDATAAMHRRAQAAEAQINTTIDDCIRQGRSLGRGLANAGFMGEREKRVTAEDELAAARRTLDEIQALIRDWADDQSDDVTLATMPTRIATIIDRASSSDTETRDKVGDDGLTSSERDVVAQRYAETIGTRHRTAAAVPETRDKETR